MVNSVTVARGDASDSEKKRAGSRKLFYGKLFLTNYLYITSQLVSLEFFIDIKSFRSHYGPGVDLFSK
jgi:hypothetical protein